ncbi:DUF4245 domain-containing protein [Planomonospora sp. ID67723]|uniref:DUF4245 domain-containing protein n=1 Tax=Planomonospora sp. ID67723 TaxID=2738134 RepID=UPI0018C4071E|nr:DUF4245 domain-containing protein [Planomonospora sp. ID67723]MBG0826191.1 DUF4245 domain-containing protein [Planomonospora sp. ID67723]
MQRFTQGFYGYVVAMAVCLAGVLAVLFFAPYSTTPHIPRVDYSIDVANMRRAAPYQVWTPEPVPAGWVPNSSRMTDAKGVVTWRLGFATAEQKHAMLIQSDEGPAAEFANRMANSNQATGTVQIAGVTWEQRYREDKNQRSLVRLLPDTTLVVTGTAEWAELTALATSLKQQPKGASGPTPTTSPAPAASPAPTD